MKENMLVYICKCVYVRLCYEKNIIRMEKCKFYPFLPVGALMVLRIHLLYFSKLKKKIKSYYCNGNNGSM